MIYGRHALGRSTFADIQGEVAYGENWLLMCATPAPWVDAKGPQATLADPCDLIFDPVVPPYIPPALIATWAGIRIPVVAQDSSFQVQTATLELTAAGNWTGYASIEVRGDLEPQPSEFDSLNTVKSRPLSAASVQWAVPEMTDGVQYSVDVTEIARELLAQAGRNGGDPVAFILIGIAGRREFEAGTSPVLTIIGA